MRVMPNRKTQLFAGGKRLRAADLQQGAHHAHALNLGGRQHAGDLAAQRAKQQGLGLVVGGMRHGHGQPRRTGESLVAR